MTGKLQITSLGGIHISRKGQPVTGFVSVKVQALLAYLAVTARPHTREALAALFWGEMSDEDAKANLRQALANLRKLAAPNLLIARDTVEFNGDSPYSLDVEAFEKTVTANLQSADPATTAPGQKDDRSIIMGELQAALDLYRGNFLEGIAVRDAPEFEDWLVARREHYHDLAVQGFNVLAARLAAQGTYREAITAVRRSLALDPWREESHRQLMTCLVRTGQRSAALAQYETCRGLLDRELGIQPAIETIALYEKIRSAESMRWDNLPPQSTPFIGRQNELAEINRLLADPACRLLTLVGPGGIGKTRLSIQAAASWNDAFLHGVCFVPLAATPTGNPEILVNTIADALHFSFSAQPTPRAQLLNFLREKDMLLVLDNAEHLPGLGGLLSEILESSGDTKILVTSRLRLNLHGEWIYQVRGMALPGQDEAEAAASIHEFSAVQLFIRNAARVNAHYNPGEEEIKDILQICSLVDGFPLGIELAAAWTHTLDCRSIVREIQKNLDFLNTSQRDLPERQRSLRAVFENSWRILSEAEQNTFQRLSVFRGGFDQEAARHIAEASFLDLAALVDHSLLQHYPDGHYEMHEVLRQYAEERLSASSDHENTHDRHCEYYARTLHENEERLKISTDLDELAVGIENMRAAWQWALEHRRLEEIDRFLVALHRYYEVRGWFQEGTKIFGQAVELLATVEGKEQNLTEYVRTRALARQASFFVKLSSIPIAKEALRQSMAVFERLGPKSELLYARNRFASAHIGEGDLESAARLSEEALTLARELYEPFEEAMSLYSLCVISYLRGDYPQARKYCQQCLSIRHEIGDDYGIGHCLNILGLVALYLGDYAETEKLIREGLSAFRAIRSQYGEATCFYNLGILAYFQGELESARSLFWQALSLHQSLSEPEGTALCLNGLGMADVASGRYAEARRFCSEGLSLCRKTGANYPMAYCLKTLGDASRLLGEPSFPEAETYLREGLSIAMQNNIAPAALHVLLGMAELYIEGSEPRQNQALEWLSLVMRHPAGIKFTRDHAARLWKQVTADLPPELAAKKQKGWADNTLEMTVKAIQEVPALGCTSQSNNFNP